MGTIALHVVLIGFMLTTKKLIRNIVKVEILKQLASTSKLL